MPAHRRPRPPRRDLGTDKPGAGLDRPADADLAEAALDELDREDTAVELLRRQYGARRDLAFRGIEVVDLQDELADRSEIDLPAEIAGTDASSSAELRNLESSNSIRLSSTVAPGRKLQPRPRRRCRHARAALALRRRLALDLALLARSLVLQRLRQDLRERWPRHKTAPGTRTKQRAARPKRIKAAPPLSSARQADTLRRFGSPCCLDFPVSCNPAVPDAGVETGRPQPVAACLAPDSSQALR